MPAYRLRVTYEPSKRIVFTDTVVGSEQDGRDRVEALRPLYSRQHVVELRRPDVQRPFVKVQGTAAS